MTIKEYYDLNNKKINTAYEDLKNKSDEKLIRTLAPSARVELAKNNDELRGMILAYQDIANEIAYQEGFEMPTFDCCKGK